MARKGQFTGVISLIVVVFIATGNLYGAILINDQVSESISYNAGDSGLVAEAKLKSNLYPERMTKELNYSSNIAALNLSDKAGDVSWNNNVPKETQLTQKYVSEVEEELKTQNRVRECDGPTIEDVTLSDSSTTILSATLSDNWIICSANYATANVSVSNNQVETNNIDNRYINVTRYAGTLGSEAENIAEEETPITGTGTDSGDSCPENRQSELEEAESNAKSNALSGHKSLAAEAMSGTSEERPDWMSTSSSTSFSGNAVSTVTSTPRTCEYNCRTVKDENGDEVRICDEGNLYDTEATYTVDQIDFDYSLTDSGKQIIDSNGELQNIVFDFTYKHSVN